MGSNKGTPEERFWKQVNKTDSCWLWTGTVNYSLEYPNVGGYGLIRVNGQRLRAHRYSYELHKGLIPDGLVVCHSCDNRRCVNPAHLFLGTLTDNMRDAIQKERIAKKLTWEQVAEIRKSDLSSRQIAPVYGVTDGVIRKLRRGEIWKDE